MRAPYSPAAERNRKPILQVLRRHVHEGWRILEVGAGTGQHARYFADELAAVHWQATDVPGNLSQLGAGLAADGTPDRLPAPVPLDVSESRWPAGPWHAVYTANTAHIMDWPAVCTMIAGSAAVLDPGGLLVIYGPFSRGGIHTSESNRRFDRELRERDPDMGIRDLAAMETEAQSRGFERLAEYAMPANNLLLVWRLGGAGDAETVAGTGHDHAL